MHGLSAMLSLRLLSWTVNLDHTFIKELNPINGLDVQFDDNIKW